MNVTFSYISDLAFRAATAAYVTALVCHGVEFASQRANAPVSTAAPSVRVAVSTDGRTALLTEPSGLLDCSSIGLVTTARRAPWSERFGRAAMVVTFIGLAAQIVSIAARGISAGRPPWGNMYEFSSLITATAVAVWLTMMSRTRARIVGLFVMFPVTVLVFVAGTVLYTPASSLVPALQSYWLVIHVLAVSLSAGILLFSGVASALLLACYRHESKNIRRIPSVRMASPVSRGHRRGGLDGPRAGSARGATTTRLPSIQTLDRIAYRTAIIAFPVYTFAVIAGALWAEVAWGRYLGWDPKEVGAFVTWIIYACHLHARATAGWRGARSAWISILGVISILFNLFFINVVITGLHSYAGLN